MINGKQIINGIDVSEYFINHYDNSGKLYAVEYKGNPLELQNAIKHLQKENEKLKKEHYEVLNMLKHEYDGRKKDNEQWFQRCTENHNEDSKIIDQYKQALEEIKEIAKYNQFYNPKYFMLRGDIGQIQNIKMTEIYEKCNEALNDRD